MPTTIWTGSISFGLVTVPVKLTPATKSKDVSFNQLEERHRLPDPLPPGLRADRRRGRQRRDREGLRDREGPLRRRRRGRARVPRARRRATRSRSRTSSISTRSTRSTSTRRTTCARQEGPKPYRLLVEAMTELQKVAIGRVVMRAKERLVAIRPVDGMLCVETMRYADEVVPPATVIPEDGEVSEPTAGSSRWPSSSSSARQRLRAGQVPRRVPRAAHVAHRPQGRR